VKHQPAQFLNDFLYNKVEMAQADFSECQCRGKAPTTNLAQTRPSVKQRFAEISQSLIR